MVASPSALAPAAAAASASLVCPSPGESPFQISQLENGCWNSASLAGPGLQQSLPKVSLRPSQGVSFKQHHHFGAVHHH